VAHGSVLGGCDATAGGETEVGHHDLMIWGEASTSKAEGTEGEAADNVEAAVAAGAGELASQCQDSPCRCEFSAKCVSLQASKT
jgi:hypothetical protein